MIAAMYSDAGISGTGLSEFGAWAYYIHDENGAHVESNQGILLPASHGMTLVGNNTCEFYAFLKGLEALPEGWSGPVYSDSKNTLMRFFAGWQCNGIPDDWIRRKACTLHRLGALDPFLLAGHPSKDELKQGYSDRRSTRLPVSKYNVWCDKTCCELIRAHKAGRTPLSIPCP
jgi:ribonuclease HI